MLILSIFLESRLIFNQHKVVVSFIKINRGYIMYKNSLYTFHWIFLKGSKSSKAANGSGLEGVMAGVEELVAKGAIPKGSEDGKPNGLLNGLLLFSNAGEIAPVLELICFIWSLGGNAGGGANWTTGTVLKGATVGEGVLITWKKFKKYL